MIYTIYTYIYMLCKAARRVIWNTPGPSLAAAQAAEPRTNYNYNYIYIYIYTYIYIY